MATKVQVFGTLLGSLGLRDNAVTATLVDLNGTPRIGFVPDVQSEVVSQEIARSDSSGGWTLSLYGNADIDSDYGDTLYRIAEGPGFNQFGSNVFYIGVPVSGGPYWVRDLVVTPPGGAAPQSFQVVSVDGMTGAVSLASRYVDVSGDTMTGALTLSANPTNALHAATKQYVDNNSASLTGGPFLPLSGGTMTGAIVLPGNPSTALQAAPKQYVDNTVAAVSGIYVDVTGDTMTGSLTLSGGSTNLTVGGFTQSAIVQGSASSAGTLTLKSTSHATKGKILFGTSAYDEVNNRLGVGTSTPSVPLEVSGSALFAGSVSVSGANSNLSVAGSASVSGNLSVSGTTTGITKSMVGLGSVDNTADTAKPVSTAQQTALNLKADLASPTFTGTVNAAAITTTGNVTVGGDFSVTGIGQKQYVRATSNQSITSVTPSQTASTFLVLPVVANAKYIVRAGVIITNTSGVTAPSWTGPSGATMKWVNTTASADYQSTIGGTTGTFPSLATSRMMLFEGLLQVSSTAGNLTFTGSTTTGTLQILADSYLTLERVG